MSSFEKHFKILINKYVYMCTYSMELHGSLELYDRMFNASMVNLDRSPSLISLVTFPYSLKNRAYFINNI